MSFITLPECVGKETADARVNNLIFKKKIVPGDTLSVVAELKSFSCGLARGNAKGYVNLELACSADLVVVVPDLLKNYTPSRV